MNYPMVELSRPELNDKLCPESCQVQEQFQLLQTALNELKLPDTVDRRHQPRCRKESDVTIVVLAEIGEALNVFLEGNRQCPDGVLLALTSTWLSRQPSPDRPTMDTLYVHQAATADSGGQTYLDVFEPARRVTYLVNHLMGSTTEGRRREGERLGVIDLDTPCSSSIPLNYRADDKLLTTTMCAAAGVIHPVTLGFWVPGKHSHDYPRDHPTITVVKLTSTDLDTAHATVEHHVRNFLSSSEMKTYKKVVVKPFGPTWYSCKGVTYHDRSDVSSVLQAVLDLVTRVESGTGILVQSYHPTFDPVVVSGLGRHAVNTENITLAFRVRATVARTPQNDVHMTQVVCAVSDSNIPIGRITTIPTSLATTLRQWGVTDARQRHDIEQSVRHSAESLMLELLRQEAGLTEVERGGYGCQTELLGIDFILTKQNDFIVPVMIEVNAHDCLHHVTVLETLQPQLRGRAVRTFVHNMLSRSLRFLMAGKAVVVVGAGEFSKRNICKDAREFGVKIVLVDSNPDQPARKEVDAFLHVDIQDHKQDKQHATTIIKSLARQLPHVKVDGCVTFWDDCVPLAALVAEGLNLKSGASYKAAMNAKSKALTGSVLWGQHTEPPHNVPPCVYASPMVRIQDVEDVEEAMKKIPLPAVLKLEFGSSAVGVKHVHDLQEAQQHVRHVQTTLRTELDHPGVGLGHGQTLILTPRLLGSEHDVDVVLYQGQLMAAFLSDNGPTRLPLCTETAAVMPSVLNKEHQRQLMAAAQSCCLGLGLHTGVFNVELMMTPRGPRLLEINARMGGFYLRDWIRLVYHVDILHLALMCACGVRPVLTGSSSLDEDDTDKERLMGIMLYPSRHHHALATTATPQRLRQLHDAGDIIFVQFEEEVDDSHGSFFEEPYGNLAVRGASVAEARARLTAVCTSLGLETEDTLQELLTDFVQLN